MLFNIDSNSYATRLPHKTDFDCWMKKLPTADYKRIVEEFDNLLLDGEFWVASWIPGKDWQDTVWEPIYLACDKNVQHAGFFFGLLLFDHLMHSNDYILGCTKHHEVQGRQVKSYTYFKIDNPPAGMPSF